MNAHLIRISYRGATETKPSGVVLTSQRFERNSVRIPYDHSYSNSFDIAEAWLTSNGYTIVCSGEMPGAYWAAVKQFEPLSKRK